MQNEAENERYIKQNNVEQQDSASTQPSVSAKQAKKSKMRWFWRLLLLCICILCGVVAFLATGAGQRNVLNAIASFIDGVEIEHIEGSLQEGLQLKNTRYQMKGVNVTVGQADVHIDFRCLLSYKACVETLALKETQVDIDTSQLPQSTPKKEHTPLGRILLPLDIEAKQISLDNLRVKVDDLDIHLTHFNSGISGKKSDVTLAPTSLDGLYLSLAPEAVEHGKEKVKDKAKEVVKATDWSALKERLSQPLLSKLAPVKLPFYFDVPVFNATNIRIEQKKRNDKGDFVDPITIANVALVSIQGQSDEQKVELNKFEIQSDKGNVSGAGELTLSDNYPLKWSLKGAHPELRELKIPASFADVDIDGELFGQMQVSVKSRGAATFLLNGRVSLSEPKTPITFELNSEELQYPFMPEKGVDPLKLQKVNLKLNGDLLDYQLQGRLNSRGMNLPSGSLQLVGNGDISHFSLQKLTLNALDGQAELNGKVDWQDGIEWDSAIQLNHINTKTLLPDWAAVLSGKLQSKGYAARGLQAKEWAVNVEGMDIKGTLFQKQLQLKGGLKADHHTLLNIQPSHLIYGENVITLNGVLGERSDFLAEINAPNLKGLVPKLSAGIKGEVKLQGNLTAPLLDVDLLANHVTYENLALQHLTAKGKISTEKQITADLNLLLNKFHSGDIHIDNANVTLKGTENSHSLTLVSTGKPVGGNLQINGKFDRQHQNWQGQLSQVKLQTPVGFFQNDKTVQVSYNNNQASANVSAHCWKNATWQLCFPQSFNAGVEGKVPFEIRQFELATLQEYLDKSTQVSGLINVKGDAAWFKQKAPQVNVELNANRLKLAQKLDTGTFPLVFSPVKLTAKIAENNLTLNSDIRIENNGRLQSEIQMRDLAHRRTLSGNINIDKITLALFKPLLSGGESINGDINARLTVGGSATAPQLFGHLNLTGLKAKSNAMLLDVVDGALTMAFNGATSTLKGNVKTPQSNLELSGDANWQKIDAWHTRVQAKANKFRIDIPGLAKVDISPDIEVKATPKELILGGKIDIPWARIEVQELPESAVSVSADEVIMEGSAKNKRAFSALVNSKNAPQKGQGMAIKGDVSINIGKDVRVDAYGLKTNLGGEIKVRQGNKGLGLYGQVKLLRGTFASFGQDLVIRKGVISFTGLPTQPSLDIEAIRNPEAIEDQHVTAGVKVTGIADNLDVKLFSTPTMQQDEILSYILTGRGLENSDEAGSGHSIAAALIGMSLSKGSKTVGSVGSAFGISDLNVTTAGIGDNTKVVVSGNLTPRFKVKYGVGIFAPLTELTLRYRLAPSLYLQWVSSLNQSVDLLYRFAF